MQLTISGYATALFASWYFIEELGLLFDAGEGVTAALLQKSRKIDHVFISHADRDHVTGLLQLNQLNARPGFPVICYPRDSGSFRALETFSKSFDPQVAGTVWVPLDNQSETWIRKDMLVQAMVNGHVPVAGGIIKSLSYKLVQIKEKLMPELAVLSQEEIKAVIAERGKESVTTAVRTTLLGYSGDTPVEDMDRWNHTGILIHEATFLGGKDDVPIRKHGQRHSTLEELMEAVSSLTIDRLILGHFSSRYSDEQIDRAILALCDKYSISIPVHRVLPGQTATNITGSVALNK